jgi:hypothetical protein
MEYAIKVSGDSHQNAPFLNGVADGHKNFRHFAILGRKDEGVHFHGFDSEQLERDGLRAFWADGFRVWSGCCAGQRNRAARFARAR